MTKPNEERVIKHQDRQPCGCVITEYADGSKMIAPCVPCGLAHTSRFLAQAAAAIGQAAQALDATATTIRAQQSVATLKKLTL